MIWPTPPPICRRVKVCKASGIPLKVCRPLSTPPMRDPRPPARIRPVMSCGSIINCYLLNAGENFPPGRPKGNSPPRGAAQYAKRQAWGPLLASDVVHFDPLRADCRVGWQGTAKFRVAISAALPDVANGGDQIGVRGLTPDQRTQVVAAGGKQTQIQLAFSGEPGAIAAAAESLCDTADDANFTRRHVMLAGRVGIAPARSGLAGAGGPQWQQWQLGINQLDNLARWQYLVHAPAVGGTDIHVFNKAQHHARAFEAARHGKNLVLVGAALDHQ